MIGQDTLKKLKEENVTGITLKTLNTVCAILDLQSKGNKDNNPEGRKEKNGRNEYAGKCKTGFGAESCRME